MSYEFNLVKATVLDEITPPPPPPPPISEPPPPPPPTIRTSVEPDAAIHEYFLVELLYETPVIKLGSLVPE